MISLISISVALSQTPAYTTIPQIVLTHAHHAMLVVCLFRKHKWRKVLPQENSVVQKGIHSLVVRSILTVNKLLVLDCASVANSSQAHVLCQTVSAVFSVGSWVSWGLQGILTPVLKCLAGKVSWVQSVWLHYDTVCTIKVIIQYLGFKTLVTVTLFFCGCRDFALDVGWHELGSESPPTTKCTTQKPANCSFSTSQV